jgi:hypothetical protein
MPYPFELTRVRGRNGWDAPIDLPPDICAEVRNMHFYTGALGQKRAGSTAQTLTGDAHTGYNALIRLGLGQLSSGAEFFIVSADATVKILRITAGTAKVNLGLTDAVASRAWDVSSAVLNDTLYLAYDSAVNRLHALDGIVHSTIRRTGLATPAAPTVANTGAGAYPATIRYYKVAFTRLDSSVFRYRSPLSAAVSFTPSGAGTAARITIPALLGEQETDWEIYASADNGTFYFLATVVNGTTTYDDSALVATYASGTAEPSAGTYTNWPSVKYLATDGTRLLGYGVWETATGALGAMEPKSGRVYFSPVLDTLGPHDQERVSNTTTIKGWIDITRNAGSIDRGLAGPLNGAFLTFQDQGVTMLSPTGSALAPFRRVPLDPTLGAVNNQSIVQAVDEVGRPCIYFLDPEFGPYRYGAGGFQRVGKDVQDIWDTVNLEATGQVAWGMFYKSLNLLIFAVTTGVNNDPDTMLVFDVTEGRLTDADGVRNGWVVWDGDFAGSRCGVMFGTLGVTMGTRLIPYVGRNTGTKLLRYDTTKTQDDTTSFRGYLTSGAMTGPELPKNKSVLKAYLLAKASSGVTLTQSWTRNFGDETNRTDTVSLTAAGSESRVLKRFESPELAEAYVAQVTLGDASAAATAFTLERWWAQVEDKELR